MRRSSNTFMGGNEANSLIGAWQSIVGADPWQSIIGADVSYLNPYQRNINTYRRHHTPWYGNPYRRHHTPWYGNQYQYQYQRPYVRDHRAYIMGDNPYALLGAEAAAAAAQGPAAPPAALAMPPAVAAPAAPSPPPSAMLAPPAVQAPSGEEVPPGHPAHPDNHVAVNDEAHPAHPGHPHHHRWRNTGGCAMPMQPLMAYGPPSWPYEIPPRNLLVNQPGPTRADRVILPMSSGVNILPNTSAQITSRPQNHAFRAERCIIAGAQDWVVNDIKVGNVSQFSQSGDIPGEMFGAQTIDAFVKFTTCQTAMDFVIVTTFVGASESGAPFVCGVLGTAAN